MSGSQAQPQAPAASTLSTKRGIVNKWLDSESYLRYLTKDKDERHQREIAITIGELLDLLHTNGPRSWLSEDLVNMSLVLLTELRKRSNCYVLPTFDAHQLCQMGLGELEPDTNDLLRETLQNNGKRWIIVPCNDGMMQGNHDPDKQKQKTTSKKENAKPTRGTKTRSTTRDSTQAEKFNDTSSIDPDTPMPDATERPEVHKPDLTTPNPVVDDQHKRKDGSSFGYGIHWGLLVIDKEKEVARWLDGLVGLRTKEKNGKRVTSISHMFAAGTAAGKVLCGYDKILGRERGKFTAGTLKQIPHQRSDNTFRTGDAGACGPHMFACLKHIYANPRALEDLYDHFKNKRAAGDFRRGGGSAFHSKNIRQEIQDMIHRERERNKTEKDMSLALNPQIMQILGLDFTRQQLIDALARFNRMTGNETRDSDDDLDGNGGGYGGGDDRDDESNDNPDDQGMFGDPPIPMRDILEKINHNKAHYQGLTKEERFRAAWAEVFSVQHVLLSKQDANKAELEKQRLEQRTKDGLAPPERTVYPFIQFPKQIARLPRDFADDEEVDGEQLKEWQAVNSLSMAKFGLGKKSTDLSVRAALQSLSGVSFINERPDRLLNIWLNDPEVFSAEDREAIKELKSDGIVTRRMDERYDVLGMENTGRTLNFLTMPFEEIKQLLTKRIKKHPSLNNGRRHNRLTFRAILLVRYGGSFSQEHKNALESGWILDSNVFTVGEDYKLLPETNSLILLNGLQGDGIRARMQAAYEGVGSFEDADSSSDDDSDNKPGQGGGKDQNEPDKGADDNGAKGDAEKPSPKLQGGTTDSAASKQPTGDSTKRKCSNDTTDAATPAQKKVKLVKLSPPDFHKVTKLQLHAWLRYVPQEIKDKLLEGNEEIKELKSEYTARIWCQRMFSDTFQNVQSEEPLSEESMQFLRPWKLALPSTGDYKSKTSADLKHFLNKALMKDIKSEHTEMKYGKTVTVTKPIELPDLRNDREKWPGYYLRKLVEKEEREEKAVKAVA
ncbi:hypothetical protein CC86DRAFT_420965 [Ophiobolus disseminans]|uniref:Ubiquitin-like protease family profile domain-containing protein n=1 Tax=Ophiobolus disseminans TaxID=1469910 RepID=A0A6A6ZVM4_9PLEO|nr:hypothetical protein CC86DRAFT_420965 [Ophiobolus disseminans]